VRFDLITDRRDKIFYLFCRCWPQN